MDRQALEYLENKTKEAREIVNQIDELKKSVEHLGEVHEITFAGYVPRAFFNVKPLFVENMKKAYAEEARKEIKLLEKELARL